MSYTTIKAVYPEVGAEDLEELGNSHGSAPVVWTAFGEKYLGLTGARAMFSDLLWTIHKLPNIPSHHRMMMMMTYDNAIVMKKDYPQAAKDIRAFLEDFPLKDGWVNHWPRIAEIFESDPECPSIGFHMTSVGEDPFQGDWNEEMEDYDSPHWEKYWSVYDEPGGEL
jgi:hypothetical protein